MCGGCATARTRLPRSRVPRLLQCSKAATTLPPSEGSTSKLFAPSADCLLHLLRWIPARVRKVPGSFFVPARGRPLSSPAFVHPPFEGRFPMASNERPPPSAADYLQRILTARV